MLSFSIAINNECSYGFFFRQTYNLSDRILINNSHDACSNSLGMCRQTKSLACYAGVESFPNMSV